MLLVKPEIRRDRFASQILCLPSEFAKHLQMKKRDSLRCCRSRTQKEKGGQHQHPMEEVESSPPNGGGKEAKVAFLFLIVLCSFLWVLGFSACVLVFNCFSCNSKKVFLGLCLSVCACLCPSASVWSQECVHVFGC